MATSLREQILAWIQTTLTAITTANGYDNTVASVQRFSQTGQTTVNVPLLILREINEVVEDGPTAGSSSALTKRLTIHIGILTRQDPTSTTSGETVLNSLRNDVERALMADRSCNNLAIDLIPKGSEDIDIDEGQPDVGTVMEFEIWYRHLYLNGASPSG